MTPACKKKLKVTNTIVESLKESISEVKSGGQRDKEKKHALNIIRSSVLKKYSKALGKNFSVSHNARKMNTQWWKQKQRKRRSDAIRVGVKQSVKDFFLSAEVSREVPCKREVVRIKTETGKKETLQKHVMTMTLAEAHKLYKTKHPSHKIGLTSFSKLKPLNVRKVSETSRITCLCQICCNMALKIEALTTLKRAGKEEGMVDDIQIDKKSLSHVTFCSFEHEPSAKCLTRNCENCGVEGLRKYLEPLDTKTADEISWHHWGTIEIKKDEKLKRCVSCVLKKTDFQTFVAALEKDMIVYPARTFRASWQQKQMGVCVEKLPQQSVSIVMDFSENYGCVFQSEVQSGFFDRNQVTIHPMMCYYKGSLGDKVATVKHAIIGISEETKHDADLAIAFENRVLKTLENTGVNIEEVHEWTDGCAAQYKGKKAFADISLRKEPTVVRNYFETSHGKNVCDGLGATVKNACYRAVISNREVIGNAEDVYNFCQNNLKMETVDNERNTVSRREFVFIENANRNRPDIHVQTLTGTRKLHSVKSSGKECELFVRNLSCYCDVCVKGNNPGCENADIVHNWEQRHLKLIDQPTDSKNSKKINTAIKIKLRFRNKSVQKGSQTLRKELNLRERK